MAFNLRKRTLISYYEPEEPSFDDYLYCDQCSDFVYEYCAIHGPLLVIPDDKVPGKTNFPPYVPRAALTIPHVFLHLAPSIIPGAGLGVFSTLTLPRGVRFGPYCGDRTQQVNSMYCWQIYDRNNKRRHVVDAADGDRSNWMRYVNCARHCQEQNMLAYQYQGQLYYRTIKIIPRFTELMVFYGSEFANVLRIDLCKYNKKEYYENIISTPIVIKNKTDKNTTNHSSDAIKANFDDTENVNEEYINTDKVEFFDDQHEEEGNSQIETNVTIECKTNTNEKNCLEVDENSPIQVKYSGDNIIINFKTNNIDENSLKCEICQKTFKKIKYLRQHTKTHSKTYNCEFCEFKCNLKCRFDDHIEKHKTSYKYSCQICHYKSNTRTNFYRHSVRHENKKNVDKSIKTYNDYFATPKQCDICDFTTCSRRKFSLHKSRHRGNIYKCDFCQYSNYCKYNLSRHILRNH